MHQEVRASCHLCRQRQSRGQRETRCLSIGVKQNPREVADEVSQKDNNSVEGNTGLPECPSGCLFCPSERWHEFTVLPSPSPHLELTIHTDPPSFPAVVFGSCGLPHRASSWAQPSHVSHPLSRTSPNHGSVHSNMAQHCLFWRRLVSREGNF